MTGRLDGMAAFITGGGSGVGRAIARAFAREGAAVSIVGRDPAKLATVQQEIEADGGRACALVGDVGDGERMKATVAEALRTWGRMDVLVNNAAVYQPRQLVDTTESAWDETMRANLTGPFLLAKLAYEALAETRGSVLNISSTLALRPVPGCAAYCVSKAALDMLTRVMALEWATKGVRVNGLVLGIVDTPIHAVRAADNPTEWRKAVDAMHPIGRMGQPHDVAELAVHLTSATAGWITGSLYTIDGGISLV